MDKTKEFEDFKKKYLKVNEVTETDKNAIFEYMSAKSYIINDKLRNRRKLTSDEERFRIELDNVLDKMPAYSGNFQRSVHIQDKKALVTFLSDYIEGNDITFSEYLSTKKGAVYNPDAKVQIYIKDAQNGKDISKYNTSEQEVLYKRNASFHVENVVVKDGKTYILKVEINE